jgi:hypothetical protein
MRREDGDDAEVGSFFFPSGCGFRQIDFFPQLGWIGTRICASPQYAHAGASDSEVACECI